MVCGLSSRAWSFLVLQHLWSLAFFGLWPHQPASHLHAPTCRLPPFFGCLLYRHLVLGLGAPERDFPSITATKHPFPNYIPGSPWTHQPVHCVISHCEKDGRPPLVCCRRTCLSIIGGLAFPSSHLAIRLLTSPFPTPPPSSLSLPRVSKVPVLKPGSL